MPKTKNGFALTRIIKDLKNDSKITKKRKKKILILFFEKIVVELFIINFKFLYLSKNLKPLLSVITSTL
jgi:hypothetical protein